jgi:hypothetical protein
MNCWRSSSAGIRCTTIWQLQPWNGYWNMCRSVSRESQGSPGSAAAEISMMAASGSQLW